MEKTKVITLTGEQFEDVKDMTVEDFLKKVASEDEAKKNIEKELVDLLFNAILEKEGRDIATILELKFKGDNDGLKIEVSGSNVAGEAFCDLGEDFAAFYEETKAKLAEVASWMNDRMVELGAEGHREI